ncbi:MAG: 30S ribosomal protein S17 [Planctomycetes bacterium]|nr:30S ribosomal protein S17 [Planctomycetota bacterium]
MSNTTTNAAAGGAGSAERNLRKVMRGMVTSNKMNKTLVVQVDRKVRHPLYEKFISRRTKLYAHDEQNEAKVGDIVEVCQTRPLSKLKRWRLVRVVQKASS